MQNHKLVCGIGLNLELRDFNRKIRCSLMFENSATVHKIEGEYQGSGLHVARVTRVSRSVYSESLRSVSSKSCLLPSLACRSF